MKNNITEVTNNHLCCMCGGCSYICPQSAISMNALKSGLLYPEVDKEKCNHCGLCLEICPGININEKLDDRSFYGSAVNSWTGKATDNEIYANSQSGGAVTAILNHLIDEGQIDGAVVTCQQKNSLICKPIIATSRQDLITAQKSKYSPVDLLSVLSEVENRNFSVAVVGLPCHIEGLLNIMNKKKALKSRIKYSIGLICDKTMAGSAIDCLVSFKGLKINQVRRLDFRNKERAGYPGEVMITDRKNHKFFLPAKDRTFIKDFFTPPRCRLCFDKMNIFSDITVGDPHGLSNVDRTGGESLIISRNNQGDELISQIISKNIIQVKPVDYNAVCRGQCIENRKDELTDYIKIWKERGFGIPQYLETLPANNRAVKEKTTKNLEMALELASADTPKALIDKIIKIRLKKKLFDILNLPVKILIKFKKMIWR